MSIDLRSEHDRVVAELTEVVRLVGEDTTRMWATGELDGSNVRSRLTEDFHGSQDAPWFDQPFVAGREEWLAGTREAAKLYAGKGIRWTTDHCCVLPRSADEGVVSYRVVHEWPDGRPPALALFLEVWVRTDDGWHLRRHHSEKA